MARGSAVPWGSRAARTSIRLAVLVLLAAAPAAATEPAKFLPEGSLRMMGARYLPAERDFQWDTWVGGEIGLVRWSGTTLLVGVEVETILGDELRAFDANQANYHLEGALKRPWGRRTVEVFFSHVSRHAEDRPKPQTVDWNVLGLRLSGPLSRRPFPTRFLVSAGPTTRSSLVEYRFEAVGRLEADVVEKPWGAFYLSAMVRGVKTESTAVLPRSGFLDVNAEGGARIRRGQRSLHLFAAYERRNDVYLLVPELRNRALLGLRFGIADKSE
jgi:hypothetical protein